MRCLLFLHFLFVSLKQTNLSDIPSQLRFQLDDCFLISLLSGLMVCLQSEETPRPTSVQCLLFAISSQVTLSTPSLMSQFRQPGSTFLPQILLFDRLAKPVSALVQPGCQRGTERSYALSLDDFEAFYQLVLFLSTFRCHLRLFFKFFSK